MANKMRLNKDFAIAIILSIMSSLLFGVFFTVSLFGIHSSNGIYFFTSMSFFETLIALILILITKSHIHIPRKRYVINSIIFSAGLIIFFSSVDSANLVILSEITTINVVLFTFINLIHHKDILTKSIIVKISFGTAIVIIAIMLLYGFSGITGISTILSIGGIIAILWGISNYIFSHCSKHAISKSNMIFWLIFFQLIVGLITMFIFNANLPLSKTAIKYSLSSAILLFLATVIMVYSYDMIKKYKNVERLVNTSILFLLSESDIIFISILYAIFIGSINLYIISSIILLIGAIYLISTINKDKI